MPGKDFEQQVRETMGPWRLEPSGEVWGRLEAGLQRKKRRRRAFYVFLLAGLLTGAALMRYGFLETGTGGQALTQQVTEPSALPLNQPAAKEDKGSEATRPVEGVEPIANRRDASSLSTTTQNAPGIPGQNGQVKSPQEARSNASAVQVQARLLSRENSSPETVADAQVLNRKNSSLETVANARTLEQDTAAMALANEPRMPLAFIASAPRDHRSVEDPFPVIGVASDIPVSALSIPAPVPDQPGILPEKYTRKKSLQFGISGGVGRTAFSEGLNLSTAKAADFQSGPTTGSGSGNPPPPSYEYRQDPSTGWTLGAWMRSPISRRWSFTTGLAYLQYSTRTAVGAWAGDSVFGYFNGRAVQYSNTSYEPGNEEEHINRYHLLQVPLEFTWQLNKGEKLPISWSFGLTPGYLLSSNALVQDSSQAMYHHPDNQRRFQLGFRTGIMFRLMPASAHPLELGPVMQYQLNQVFTDAIQQNGHLYYLGLEARLPIFSVSRKQR